MQMKHFASCVGVNNVECEPQEKEHEVVPFSCASRGNVNMLGASRRIVGGGVLRCSHVMHDVGSGPRDVGTDPPYYEPNRPEQNVVINTRFGSRNLCCNLLV